MRKMPIQEPIVIRASDLRKLHFCQRKAWLDIHGDVTERDLPTNEQTIRLIGGVSHEEEVHEATTSEIRQHVVRTWREGVEMTRVAMQQGTRGVIGAFLEAEFEMGDQRILVRGKADRIVPLRLSGHTVYAPIEIKHYRNVTASDELQLDCYIWLLGQIQGIRPPAEFWMGRGVDGLPDQRIHHQYDETRLMQAFGLLLQYHLREANEPDVYIDSRCKQCHWLSACRREATATHDLSLINRLRKDSREELLAADVQTLKQLIEIDTAQLCEIKGIKSTAEQFHAQARAWVEDRPIFYREPSSLCVGDVWHVDTEYYPNHATNGYELWSIGWSRGDELPSIILVAEGQAGSELTLKNGQRVLVVSTADDAWHLFAEIVAQDDAPIFHWSPADKTALGKKAPQVVIDRIADRFIDLERHFVKSVQLPVYGTSIKDIAAYVGFTWSGHDYWLAAFRDYETWLSKGDETALARTCAYQSDDVSALAVVRRWMIENYPGQSE
jgi:predicted RecB family nuclease